MFTFGLNIRSPLEASLIDVVTLNTDFAGASALELYPRFAQFQLKQTGEIPADAKSLRFSTSGLFFELKLDQSVVPLSYDPLAFTFGAGQTVGADVSRFAGQTVTLELSTSPFTFVPMPPRYPWGEIYGLHFSPELIPEPSVEGLIGLGGLVWFTVSWRARFRRRDRISRTT